MNKSSVDLQSSFITAVYTLIFPNWQSVELKTFYQNVTLTQSTKQIFLNDSIIIQIPEQ